jgi:hypothetical protein
MIPSLGRSPNTEISFFFFWGGGTYVMNVKDFLCMTQIKTWCVQVTL